MNKINMVAPAPKESEDKINDSQVVSAPIQFFDNRMGLLTIDQVAQSLGKKPQTIRNMIARRELPFVRIGNKNMVLEESLRAWLRQKEFKPWQ